MDIFDSKAKESLCNGIDTILRSEGFVSSPPYWRRKGQGTTAVLCLENYHSSYLFYITIGVCMHGFDQVAVRRPGIKHLHASARLSQLVLMLPESNNRIVLKKGQEKENRASVEKVLKAVSEIGCEVLHELLSVDGVKRVLLKYGDRRWQIRPELREMLFGSATVEVPGELPLGEKSEGNQQHG
jgi:hypothetical protein